MFLAYLYSFAYNCQFRFVIFCLFTITNLEKIHKCQRYYFNFTYFTYRIQFSYSKFSILFLLLDFQDTWWVTYIKRKKNFWWLHHNSVKEYSNDFEDLRIAGMSIAHREKVRRASIESNRIKTVVGDVDAILWVEAQRLS